MFNFRVPQLKVSSEKIKDQDIGVIYSINKNNHKDIRDLLKIENKVCSQSFVCSTNNTFN